MKQSSLPGETLGQKFWNAVGQRSKQVALRQKLFGVWDEITWTEYGAHARRIGMGLAALGLQPGDCVSILANTRREWTYCDFGAMLAGLVVSGVYPTDSAEQLEFLCADSQSKILIVEDD